MKKTAILAMIAACSGAVLAGNTQIDSFNEAKKKLERNVYSDHRVTFYCMAGFDEKKNITLPEGFSTPSHEKRAKRVEWEHVVPAENFGRAFAEWRGGHSDCVDNNGREFKGRKCAEKVNPTFRYMLSDMYNLYPAIGAVNALRSNYRYAVMPDVKPTFGSCSMKVDGNRAEPPENARGAIARTYLYMDDTYREFSMSSQDSRLMQAWNKMYPVDEWECVRAWRIAKIQGNENKFVADACRSKGWYRDVKNLPVEYAKGGAASNDGSSSLSGLIGNIDVEKAVGIAATVGGLIKSTADALKEHKGR